MVHGLLALPQGLVPPSQGAKLEASKPQGWEELGEESVLAAPRPCRIPYPRPWPLQSPGLLLAHAHY